MAEVLRPNRGGFLRPFGLGVFIRDYLMGRGPYGAPRIDPSEGACQTDIREHYKAALFKRHAEDAVSREVGRRIRLGLPPMTSAEEDRLMLQVLEEIPYKFTSIRSHSFVRYFHLLIQLGWVEPTGREEISAFQEGYIQAKPRRYFRLTERGRTASDFQWLNPLRAKYGHSLTRLEKTEV
jgi:hypothetical protein